MTNTLYTACTGDSRAVLGQQNSDGTFHGNQHMKQSLNLAKDSSQRARKDKSEIPTPPYLIARPVVTVKRLELQSFLVLATDGLWDVCTNREVVDLVVRWLEAQPNSMKEMKMTPNTIWWKSEPQQKVNYPPGFDFLQR